MKSKFNLGIRQMNREIEVFGAIFVLFAVLVFGIYFGINSSKLNFDNRNEAAGRTIFLENGQDLQAAIDNASTFDAIFLKPGTYTTNTGKAFEIRNKNIRILGSGRDYTRLTGGASQNIINVVNSKLTLESLTVAGALSDGIKIDDSPNTEVKIRDLTIVGNAGSGINSGAKTIIQTTLFDQNGVGISANGNLIVENSIIRNSATNGISITDSANASNDSTITNTLLHSNKGTQILLGGGKNHTIKSVTVYNGGKGIICSLTPGRQNNPADFNVNISNTIIQKHTGEGLVLFGTNSQVTYSNVFQNGTNYTPNSLTTGEGNLSVDAGFVSETDFRLKPSSPVKDKGIPPEKDADGTRIDMGAYGGSPLLLSPNNTPEILSKPPEFVKPGETYYYEVKATDPDGDALSYIVVNDNLPHWLKQEVNKFSGTPTKKDIGYYGIILVVSDRRGGNVVHAISINVLPEGRATPPIEDSPKPTATITPTNTQTIAPKITIINPTSNSVFSKTNNEIKWSINEGVTIEKYVLSYSANGKDFTTITTLPGNITSFKWEDIDKLTSGKYFIKIEATDRGNPPVTVATISPQFEISNTNTQNPENITITKNSPADNDVVRDPKQQIVVEFRPDAELDKSRTVLKVNGSEVAYGTTINTIFYQPQVPYEGNKVEVEVTLVTKKGSTASKQWIFNIQREASPKETTPDTKITTKMCIPGTALCVPQSIGVVLLGFLILILLLLILYFVIKLIKNIRDQREGRLEDEFTEYYEYDELNPYQSPSNMDQNSSTSNMNSNAVVQNSDTDQYYTDQNDPQILQVNPAYNQNQMTTNPQIANEQYSNQYFNQTLATDQNTSQLQQGSYYATQTDTNSNVQSYNLNNSEIDANTNSSISSEFTTTQNINDNQVYIQSLMKKYGISPNNTGSPETYNNINDFTASDDKNLQNQSENNQKTI